VTASPARVPRAGGSCIPRVSLAGDDISAEPFEMLAGMVAALRASTMTNMPSTLDTVTTDQLTHVTGGAGADISSWLGIANKVFGMIGSGSKSSSGSSSSSGGNPLSSLLSGGKGLLGMFGGGNKSSGDGSTSSSDGGGDQPVAASDSGGE
jgi:hypothetical protein